MSYSMLLYFIFARPSVDPIENYLLIFNEFIVLICTLHLYLFSLGDENIDFINNVGWSYAGMIILQIIVNLGCRIYQLTSFLVQLILKKIAQLREKEKT